MSTDIRASLSLAALSAQAARPESMARNQILDIGSEAAFPQVLERQTNMRTESRANGGDDASRSSKREEAVTRQPGGKRLPARAERNDERGRADQAARQRKDVRDSHAADTAATKADKTAGERKQVQDEENVDAAATDVSAAIPPLSPDQAQMVPAPVLPVSAEMAIAVGDGVAAATTDPALSGEMAATAIIADAAAAPATPSSDAAELAPGTVVVDPVLLEAGSTEAAADVAAAVAEAVALVDGAAIPDPAVAPDAIVPADGSALSPATTQNPRAELAPAADATRNPLAAGNNATLPADRLPTQAAVVSDDAVATGEPEATPDLMPAEKSESRADADKGTRAMPERMAFREQLVALAQQVDGGNRAAASATKKSDTVQDAKGFALTRNLESLSAARAETGKPVSTGIQTLLTNREWAGEVGQRLLMMVSSKIKSAEIHLNPKELGPMEVRIRMHEDKAHVVFTSQVPQTREALEQAVPRLREMLDQSGVTLGNVNVQDHGAQHSHQRQQPDQQVAGGSSTGQAVEEAEAVPVSRRELSLVDFYA